MSTTHELVDELTRFLRNYYWSEIGRLAQRYPREQQSVYVDYADIYQYDPDIAADLQDRPREMLEYFEEALRLYDLPVDEELSGAHVRIYNLPEEDTLDVADVPRHENIGCLLGVRGQVQKVSDTKPRVLSAEFVCQRCGSQTTVDQTGDRLQLPSECQGCERDGPFDLDPAESTWTDHQFASIQQLPERTQGGGGATVGVHLEDDLIHEFNAGDRVTLTGIPDIEELGKEQRRSFDTTIDAQAIVREQNDYDDVDIDEYREEIEAIASGERGDPYELLIDSINPEHKGAETVKLAIALQMFGGWSRNGRVRGDSHILLMGDPGCGKSTFLREVDELAPRSTYASGKGASAAGLTAAAVSDDFGDTEWGLEAGALVLADGGVACIDEIDKVDDTAVSSMHDALESQKVEVNKAGINTTLNSRTAMLAAGNPAEGRFDPYQSRAQQIDLGPTLMSRFDLMFMISDSPSAEDDREVIEHMMRSRRAAAKKEHGRDLTVDESRSVEPAISHEVLRAYIAYAKEESQPYLGSENSGAQEHLREEFLKLRLANSTEDDNPVPVTFRQEEAIERLAEASARVRLSDEVTENDVDRALDLVKQSMKQVGVDPETGEFDADIVETGRSQSQRDRRQQILTSLEDRDEATVSELAEILDIEISRLQQEVEAMKHDGKIYELGSGDLRRT